MSFINRLTYIELEAPDLAAEADHYENILGLRLVDRSNDRLHFGLGSDDVTLTINRADHAACTGMGFELHAGKDASDLEKVLKAHGTAAERRTDSTPAGGAVLSFLDPKGTRINLHANSGAKGAGYVRTGIVPNKLGHVSFTLQSLDSTLKFYREVLGFRVSDWLSDFFVFLRCGPDHHTCNFIGNAKHTQMHHMAFEVRDFARIRDACDFLSSQGHPLIWGPVRHGCGHNISIYYRDPAGHMIELFCELDRIQDEATEAFEPRPWHQQFPQGPQTWHDVLKAASQWGTPLPAGFLD